MEHKKENGNPAESRALKKSNARVAKIGGYATLMGAIAIVTVIAFNLFVSELPPDLVKFDTSSQKLYTISPQTEEVLAALDQDVTFYYIALPGSYDLPIQEMIERYASLSDRITVEYVDPLLYPNFTAQYTTEMLVGNDIIVEIGDKSRLVSYTDIYDVIYNVSYLSEDITYDTIFQGESALTNAISFLTTGNMPVIYNITGHGEVAMEQNLESFVLRQNMELKSLNIVSDGIPEDADALILLGPKSDISDLELEALYDYLSGGGNLLLITDYIDKELENVGVLAERYGLQKTDGLLVDWSSGYSMSGYPINLMPDMPEHAITEPLLSSGYGVVMPVCHGITISMTGNTAITAEPILMTSAGAFLKEDAITSEVLNLAKEDDDVAGVYAVGVAATEQPPSGEASHLVWFSTSEFLKETYDGVSSGANRDLFVNAIAWMCGHEDAVSIHPKTISTQYLRLSAGQSATLAVLFIGVLPFSVAAVGGVIWYRRKKS